MAARRDNTVFLQDVLSNALIAVLALATVSMIQIAMGGMERYVQAVSGPELGADPASEVRPETAGDPRWQATIPRSAAMLWVVVDLPAAAAAADFAAAQGSRAEPRRWRTEETEGGRRWELWSLNVAAPPAWDENWTLALADPLPAGERARVTVLADDRRYTGANGFKIDRGAALLSLHRPLRGALRAREP